MESGERAFRLKRTLKSQELSCLGEWVLPGWVRRRQKALSVGALAFPFQHFLLMWEGGTVGVVEELWGVGPVQVALTSTDGCHLAWRRSLQLQRGAPAGWRGGR